jgi:hypothetical protein
VEEKVEQNIRETQHNKQEIEQLKEELRRVRSAAEAEKEERSDALAEELREREMRRNNIIIHGLREPEHIHQARDKMENDRQTCGEIFNIIGARVRAADLRFCRRIGERGRDPRPLVIGMRSEEEKRTVLDRAGALRGSRLDNISVGPDLTKMQRRAEEKLTREAESRNGQLTTEDREKNLKWLVVGRRGEKRLIKAVERDQQQFNRRGTQLGDYLRGGGGGGYNSGGGGRGYQQQYLGSGGGGGYGSNSNRGGYQQQHTGGGGGGGYGGNGGGGGYSGNGGGGGYSGNGGGGGPSGGYQRAEAENGARRKDSYMINTPLLEPQQRDPSFVPMNMRPVVPQPGLNSINSRGRGYDSSGGQQSYMTGSGGGGGGQRSDNGYNNGGTGYSNGGSSGEFNSGSYSNNNSRLSGGGYSNGNGNYGRASGIYGANTNTNTGSNHGYTQGYNTNSSNTNTNHNNNGIINHGYEQHTGYSTNNSSNGYTGGNYGSNNGYMTNGGGGGINNGSEGGINMGNIGERTPDRLETLANEHGPEMTSSMRPRAGSKRTRPGSGTEPSPPRTRSKQ